MNVALPEDSDTSEGAREEWVLWSLPIDAHPLHHNETQKKTKAVGFLAMAHASTPEAWSDAVAALGADGHFLVEYMAEQRRVSRLARASFKEEARKLGATKFVGLPMSRETTALMDELLHCIALHCIELHCTALHCIALHCIALHCIALHCIALHCIVLHCIALHCIALHCIALHCSIRFSALHNIASH